MKRILSFILSGIIVLCGCDISNIDNVELADETESIVTFVAVGDNLIHDSVYYSVQSGNDYDFKPIYAKVKPFISQFDLKFVNQETILGGSELGLSSYPCFNSPFEVGDALLDTGFNLISVANNHTLDRGEEAVRNAVEFWSRHGIVYSGAEISENKRHIKQFFIYDIRFAFVAYTYGTNGIAHPDDKYYLTNLYDSEKAAADIQSVRSKTDFIIVSMHWGEEYKNYPNETQKKQASELADLGVDLIIGHHPHVIQPIEFITNKAGHQTMVIYSLGNFLSGQIGIDRLIGMAVSIDIKKQGSKVSIENPQAQILYHYRDYENRSYHVIPFIDIPDDLEGDYEKHFNNKKKLIRYYNKEIEVT